MSLDRNVLQGIDLEDYDTHIRRLKYDDRDCIMYENMLQFLWEFIIGKRSYPDMNEIYEEFSFWNQAMIDKVFYQEHALAYANIRRCYQSIVELLRHQPQAALSCIREIGVSDFSYDGKAPKTRMDARGHIFRPMSKLFIIYNIAKYMEHHGDLAGLNALKEEFSYAFTRFEDEEHRSHNQYLQEQMEVLSDKIIYPIEEKVYKIPWGPKDFYLYYDENSYINL